MDFGFAELEGRARAAAEWVNKSIAKFARRRLAVCIFVHGFRFEEWASKAIRSSAGSGVFSCFPCAELCRACEGFLWAGIRPGSVAATLGMEGFDERSRFHHIGIRV